MSQIAPFLLLDKDPYAVVSDGKLYWIQDAYTVSDRYPYSQPQASGTAQGSNYIRNSVKIVVDMYNGGVSFYIMDPKDPVLDVYRHAFPGVFKDLNDLSAGLEGPPALPAGSVRHPGGRIFDLPYDRSAGLLQPGRSVGSPGGKVRRRGQPDGALLHTHEASRELADGVSHHDSVHPTEERQYDRLAGRQMRLSGLWENAFL